MAKPDPWINHVDWFRLAIGLFLVVVLVMSAMVWCLDNIPEDMPWIGELLDMRPPE